METDGYYYFNRCRRCNSLITKAQILAAFAKTGEVCSCGSGMFGPTNPLWYEWFKPSVLWMIALQLLGRLAPAPEPSVAPPVPKAPLLAVPPLSPDEVRMPEEGEGE